MVKRIVYIHIEKSAGTSFRGFVRKKVLDNDFLFWWNSETKNKRIDSEEVRRAYILGGHRNVSFYKDIDALYLGVVREPKERVVSLFNYHSTKDVMQADGFDVNSLEKTLRGCEVFRNRITGGQCRYLGGKPFFDSVLNMINSRPFMVGSLDYIEKFNESFFGSLDVAVEDFLRANVGRPGYKDNLSLSEDVHAILDDLLEEDYKLYDFINNKCDGFFESNIDKVDWFELRKAFYNEYVVTSDDIYKSVSSFLDLEEHGCSDVEHFLKLAVEMTYSTIRENLVEVGPGEISRFPGIGRFVRSLDSSRVAKFEYYQAPDKRVSK